MSQAMLERIRLTPDREQGGDPENCWWCGGDRSLNPRNPLCCSPDCDYLLRVWWGGHGAGVLQAQEEKRGRRKKKVPPWMEGIEK